MADYATIEAGSTSPRGFTMVKRADGSPITTGTVNHYLKAVSGANAGKWWRASDNTWQAAETANAMTYDGADAEWTLYGTTPGPALDASPFASGVDYIEYAKESGNLHVPQSRRLRADYTPLADSNRGVSVIATSVRSAVGLASNNLDDQFAAIPGLMLLSPNNKIKTNASGQVETSNPASAGSSVTVEQANPSVEQI